MKARIVTGVALLCLGPTACLAVVPAPPGTGFASIFYSYLQTRDDFTPGGGFEARPSGSGGGVAGSIALPLNFFANGEYEYNYEHDSNVFQGIDQRVRQARAGGGYAFYLPFSPMSLYVDGQYVHYGFQTGSGNVPGFGLVRTNEDGGAVHGGVRLTVPGFAFWASGGFVDLSHSRGPEAEVGFRAIVSRYVYLFGQYRYTRLNFSSHSAFGDSKFSHDDVRFGVGMPFRFPVVLP